MLNIYESKARTAEILQAASDRLMELFPGFSGTQTHLQVERKRDDSLVSLADYESNRILTEGLGKVSSCPIKSEESRADSKFEGDYWLIDPLDGTSRFLEGAEDFAILLSFIRKDGLPQAGWMAFPARGYYLWSIEGESGCTGLQQGAALPSLGLSSANRISDGSVYVRLEQGTDCSRLSDARVCRQPIHSGEAFSRFFFGELTGLILQMGRLGPWDVAAPAAIARALGARVTNGEGGQYRFLSEDERVMIMSAPQLHEETAELARKIFNRL